MANKILEIARKEQNTIQPFEFLHKSNLLGVSLSYLNVKAILLLSQLVRVTVSLGIGSDTDTNPILTEA